VNYRHAFHAGNFADVTKHVVLVALIDSLAKKSAPMFVLDTHAGRGNYPVDAIEMQRTGEFRTGILPLLAAPSPPGVVARYLEIVRRLGVEDGKLVAYPGSPLIALEAMRPTDRAAFAELETTEAATLKRGLGRDKRAQVHARDGYEALGALLPPAEKRGLVLIDPPYESPEEYTRLETEVIAAHARWPTGVFALWYPIKHRDQSGRFLERMVASGLRRQLAVELCVQRDDVPGGLNGSGILIINPPWQLDEELGSVLPWLREQLAPAGKGRSRVSWQVPE
jgi:23S rRNA (adenine2030-N6)-methyltransferase